MEMGGGKRRKAEKRILMILMISLACLQWSKWKRAVFPIWTKSILCVWRKMNCWEVLQKLWESHSGIRVCVSPFWALSVSFNTRDRHYNLLLSQAKGHRSNCWSCWSLYLLSTVKHWFWKHWVASKGLDGLRIWFRRGSSLDMVLSNPVHCVTPQLEERCSRKDKQVV